MQKIFQFGEIVPGYDIKVLNERETRAGAGIMLMLAMTAFLVALLINDYQLIKIFVIAFFVEFVIRVFVNPKYAPFLIFGRIIVQNQKPEYVGAPQKRFAWSIGVFVATLMIALTICLHMTGAVVLGICGVCLTFLLLETSFGICVGCMIYNMIPGKTSKLCPGGVCEMHRKEEIQNISSAQHAIALAFLLLIALISYVLAR